MRVAEPSTLNPTPESEDRRIDFLVVGLGFGIWGGEVWGLEFGVNKGLDRVQRSKSRLFSGRGTSPTLSPPREAPERERDVD